MTFRVQTIESMALISPTVFPFPQLLVIVLSISLLMGQSGCATPKPKPYTPTVLSEEIREKLGTVGFVSVCFPPQAEFRKPMGKGEAAPAGARNGAGAMLGAPGSGHSSGFKSADGAVLGLFLMIALYPSVRQWEV
jgi:hypothetical protein